MVSTYVKITEITRNNYKKLQEKYYINLVNKATAVVERIDSNFERRSTVDKMLPHSNVNSDRLYFLGGAPKSVQMVTAPMKLKETGSLEEKL